MYLYNGKKVAFDALIEVNGVHYSVANAADRQAIGVQEVPDPVWPTPAENYYVTENEDGSLNIVEKSAEQLAQQALSAEATAARIYLQDTDYLFTVDKYATLTDERKADLQVKRDAARQKIRDYTATLLQSPTND